MQPHMPAPAQYPASLQPPRPVLGSVPFILNQVPLQSVHATRTLDYASTIPRPKPYSPSKVVVHG